MTDNGYKCGNCGGAGNPVRNIPDADKLIEIPAACDSCIKLVEPKILTTIICKKVRGIVLRPYRIAIAAELSIRRVLL